MIAGGSNIQKVDRELSDYEVYEAQIQSCKNAIDGMLAVIKKNSFEAGYEPSKGRLFGNLMSKYFEWDGYDIAEELLIESKKIIKQSDQELLDLINLYQEKVESLKKLINNSLFSKNNL